MTLDSGDPSRFRIAEEMLRSSPVSSALPKRTVRRIGITRMRTRLRRSRRSCRNSFLATWPITASIPVTPSRHQASCRSRLVVSIANRLLKNPFRSGCSKWSGCKAVCRRPGYPAQLGPGVLEVRRSECRGKPTPQMGLFQQPADAFARALNRVSRSVERAGHDPLYWRQRRGVNAWFRERRAHRRRYRTSSPVRRHDTVSLLSA